MYQLYEGNNSEVLRSKVADNSVQLTVTSPPYDNLRKYNGFEWDFESVARELYRVTKIGGMVVWVVSDATIDGSETGTSFKQALFFKEIGFNLHDTMIFHGHRLPQSRKHHYHGTFEFMFVFGKGIPSIANILREPCKNAGIIKGGKYSNNRHGLAAKAATTPVKLDKPRGNVWTYGLGFGGCTTDKIAFKHPAIFPERLAEDHILSWSNPGDIVLDPFVGSGTTGKMAILNNRDFIGIDISSEYLTIASERIAEAQFQKALKDASSLVGKL